MQSVFIDNSKIKRNKIINECKKFNIISFDVFDTLLKRNVMSPDVIFKLLGEFVENEFGIINFSDIRKEVARQLLKKNPYLNIYELYQEFSRILGIDQSKSDIILLKEIELENKFITFNPEIKYVYDYCKSSGKKIMAISDMYLNSTIINEMLKKEGYKVDYLFVSCDMKAGKSDGTLFNQICKSLKINKRNWLHIGDSFRGDYVGAKSVGLKAIHIDRSIVRFNDIKYLKKINKTKTYSIQKTIINNKIGQYDSYYKKFGYALVGPLLFGFTNWMIKCCKSKSINRVFFFSRDGYLLKKAFDICNETQNIKSNYMYISRRAIRIPYAVKYNSFSDIIKMLPPTKMYSMRIFFDVLGLEPENYIDLIGSYGINGLDDEILLNDIKTKSEFKEIYEKIKPDFLENAKREYEIFREYLNQINFRGKCAIVDIGWRKTMQYYLENMPIYKENELDVWGLYVGLADNGEKVKNAEGYIHDEECNTANSVAGFVGLMESIFLAQEGSTLRYHKKDNVILPELLNYEYTESDIEFHALKEIQEGAVDFVIDCNCLKKTVDMELDGYDAFLPLRSYGINPYIKDIKKFTKFKYLSETVTFFSNPKSLVHYLIHPIDFKRDLLKARWKVGFLKEVFLVKLPYYSIFCKLRRS